MKELQNLISHLDSSIQVALKNPLLSISDQRVLMAIRDRAVAKLDKQLKMLRS